MNTLTRRKRFGAVSFEPGKTYRGLFCASSDPLLPVEEQAAVGIVHTSLDGRYMRVNNKFCDVVGYSREELLETSFAAITHPEDVALSNSCVPVLVCAAEQSVTVEKRYIRKDGSVIWANVTSSLMRSRAGEPQYIITVVQDITGRKLAELALAKSENRLKRAQELAHVGNWELEPESMSVWGSEECFRIFGLPYDAENPTMDFDLAMASVLPDDRPLVEKALASLTLGSGYDIEFSLKRSGDGCERRVHSRAQLVPGGEGREMKVLGVLQDVTEMKLAEDALRASEAKHRAMIANISDVVSILDAGGTLRYISPNIERLFGRRPEELVGTNGFAVLHTEDAAKLTSRFAELIRNNDGTGTEICRYLHTDGEYRVVEASAVNMLNDPDIRGVLVSYRDITEKLRREEEIRHILSHDGLTGLFNRTWFEQELKRLDEEELPYSVVMCDVNGLKLTNDVFGHDEGDRLLIRVAGMLKDCCLPGGAAVRTGGDEFCLLLPGAPEAAARVVCEGIGRACRECEMTTGKGAYRPSISSGYAAKTSRGQTAEQVLCAAEDFMYKRKLLERNSMHSSLVASIRATMYEKSHETREHADRLVTHMRAIGERLNLSDGQLNELELLAQLHDIGKIGVDARILSCPGKLDGEDWEEMKKHPEVGYRIAMASPELKPIADGILSHHERWDGKGYPQKLKGEDIPLLARILAVVDAYDAMTNDRSYRKAMPRQEAIREIERGAGAQFDPEVAGIFLELLSA